MQSSTLPPGLEGLRFLDLDFGADTQGTQYDYNDFTLPSQTQFSQTQVWMGPCRA